LFLVNGIDYRNAVPIAGLPVATDSNGCANPHLSEYTQIGKAVEKYVIVGETHSYFDAKAGFSYGGSADSTIETGVSGDFKGWVGGGLSHIKTSSGGDAISIERGSYYGRQMLMGFIFKAWKIRYQCYDSDKTYYRYTVGPTKCMFDWAQGADVSQYDGYNHPQNQKKLQPGEKLTIYKGSAYHYSKSFGVDGFWGSSTSGHSTNVEQSITTGNRNMEHDVWGNNKPIEDNPNIMYAY